jgi:cell division protein FtsB
MMANGKSNEYNKENSSVTNPTKHTAGNVTGLTHNDYIALPARARIALIYSGDSFGEGFISLRKL